MASEERETVMEMTPTHRIAGLRISRVAPRAVSHDSLPDLAPPEDRLRSEKSRIFLSDAISLSHASAVEDVFLPSKRAEHHDTVARLTVYSLNLSVMVVSLPIGLALLLLNIIGGENIRTTAHVMALTGQQHETDQASQGIHQGDDLGCQAPSRSPDGLILSPPLAPLAFW